MLNFTAGAAGIKSALHTAKVKRIVTAHRFVELGKFEALIDELAPFAEIVYLEDVRENLSLRDKATRGGGFACAAASSWRARCTTRPR